MEYKGTVRKMARFGEAVFRDARRMDLAVFALSAAATLLIYLEAHKDSPIKPRFPQQGSGWWAWFDQWKYLQSTLAFSQGNLDAGNHWYLPGYSLAGAPFVHLTPANPFLIPNLLCLLAALWLSGVLLAELVPNWRWARIAGWLTFFATNVAYPLSLTAWVIPWTTSLVAPMVLLCLWALVRVTSGGHPFILGGVAGASGSLIAAARPVDALVVLGVAGATACVSLLWQRTSLRSVAAFILGGILGSVLAVVLLAIPYLMIYGFKLSDYIKMSDSIGFEWRLLPMRWITLVISPFPLFPDGAGKGLAERFPWIISGFAGMVACIIVATGAAARFRHLIVVGTTVAYFMLYLTYRDLHPGGMWYYGNYHYFKWTLLIFALYSVLLVHELFAQSLRQGLAVAAIAVIAVVVLFGWRASIKIVGPFETTFRDPRLIDFPNGLVDVDEGLAVSAIGSWYSFYIGPHSIHQGDRRWSSGDYKALPYPGGFLILPLRRSPSEPASLHFGENVTLLDRPVVKVRQRLSFGLPCWFGRWSRACTVTLPLAPEITRIGETLSVGEPKASVQTFEAWDEPELAGRWTNGKQASLVFNVDVPKGQGLKIEMESNAFVPEGQPPTSVAVAVNGEKLTRWAIDRGDPRWFSVTVPARLLRPDGIVIVRVTIANPRIPMVFDRRTSDPRELGMFLRNVRFEAAPPEARAATGK
ncbi:hypothetical protein C7450_11758 [Chelatococcus asaccharovorans]|uniref:Uncharacterized protein n=2 Tax=Chelatococcus asaccharovorans TaxID=28210 RepID=A0A2V3TT53_9HYPH|nr:hypothetical protein C7450_11758 [Chelatococcus asaccharovorans]